MADNYFKVVWRETGKVAIPGCLWPVRSREFPFTDGDESSKARALKTAKACVAEVKACGYKPRLAAWKPTFGVETGVVGTLKGAA